MNLLQRAKAVRAKKSLGQNFLVSESYLDKIVEAIAKSDKVVEIGPGLGFLTERLLDEGFLVTAIDLDPMAKKLILPHDNLDLQITDALKFDFNELNKPFAVAGNLPFNVGSKILMNFIGELDSPYWKVDGIQEMVLMFQLEVAKRIAAKPNNKDYGPLSIVVQAKSEVEFLFEVPAKCFYPQPKVNAGVVSIKPNPNNSLKNLTSIQLQKLRSITKQAFATRRKKLTNCLKGILDKNELEKLKINSDLRPENLSIGEFISIAKFVSQSKTEGKEEQ